jgi:hypothetical protein
MAVDQLLNSAVLDSKSVRLVATERPAIISRRTHKGCVIPVTAS